MKKGLIFSHLILIGITGKVYSQSSDDLINLLIRKGAITQIEADSLRNAYNVQQQYEKKEKDTGFSGPGHLLNLSGYTQVRYQNYQQQGKTDGIDIRRARLDIGGEFSTKWGYRILIDMVGASGTGGSAATGGSLISPTLLDGFISYKPYTFLKITAGQFIIPFSLENTTQDRNMETIDRSQVVHALVARKGDASNGLIDSIGNQNGRDIGIQLSGSILKKSNRYLVEYYLAIFNGAGINTLDNNLSRDVDARLVLHALRGIDIGGSYYEGRDRFISSVTKNQQRTRWGLEAALNLNLLNIKTEYIRGKDGNTNPIIHEGWYALASYFIWPKHLQGVFRYDSYTPDVLSNKIIHSLSTYYVFGINYYFNSWTKLQIDYSRRLETPSINNDVFNIQLQIGF